MKYIGFRFAPLSGGTRQGYTNNNIEAFKGREVINNLAREICQNSLDAHLDNLSEPVIVKFELRKFAVNDYDVFSQLKENLSGCRKYWGDEMDDKLSRFIGNAESILNNEEEPIPVLVVSDYNTKGLSGCDDPAKISTPWEALTGSDGISVKSSNNSAGSFGIGKNAPFACSSLSTVFYNTVDENFKNAFIGVARLATLIDKSGRPTQGIGKYQKNDDEYEKWSPIYADDKNAFRDCFKRSERGTDVIIIGFNQVEDWLRNIAKAVLENFFVAVAEGKLVVELQDGQISERIDAASLKDWLSRFKDDKAMQSTSQLYQAFTSWDEKNKFNILYEKLHEEGNIEIYLKTESKFRKTIANFRSSGMLIGTYYRRIYQNYAVVVVVRGDKLGNLLKDTEPPRHNKWDYKQIDYDPKRRKAAKDAIKEIDEIVLKLLRSQTDASRQDNVDAAGVAEYLPDESSGTEELSDGKDILKVKVKIGEIKVSHYNQGSTIQSAVIDEGQEAEGSVHNRTQGAKIRQPLPVHPVNKGHGNRGAREGTGTKITNMPNPIRQRAYPVNAAQGIYKIIMIPEKEHKHLYLECFAVGEDGKKDSLAMDSFTYNKKKIKISNGKAGPFAVTADTAAAFYVKFAKKERMKLLLQFSEVTGR